MNNNTVALHGAYHPNNFGDVLILAIQTNWIKEITNNEVALPFATQVYRDQIDVSSLSGVESVLKSKKIVYGAGGYLGEPTNNRWRWGFSFFKKHVKVADLGFKYDKEVAIVGTGVGEITNVFTKRKVKQICEKSKLIAVRDDESKDFLIRLGIDATKVNVTADVALSLTKESIPLDAYSTLPNTLLLNKNKLKYGIHVGIDRISSNQESTDNLFNDIVSFLNANLNIYPVLIIDNDNKVQNDAVDFFEKQLKGEYSIFRHKEIWETTAMLEKLDVVLTNKLHVGIVSYALKTIPIAIPYHPKTKRFYKQIQREDLCLDINNIQENAVYRLLNNTLNEQWKKEYWELYNVIRKELFVKALLNKELLKDFLNG